MAVEADVAVMVVDAAEVAAIATTTVSNASRAGRKKVMSDE
jgi:hypothetical protein